MRCPKCRVEMKCSHRKQNGDEIILTFACRSEQCSNYGKDVAEKRVIASSNIVRKEDATL